MELALSDLLLGTFVAISACSAALPVTALNHVSGSAPQSSVREFNLALSDLIFGELCGYFSVQRSFFCLFCKKLL